MSYAHMTHSPEMPNSTPPEHGGEHEQRAPEVTRWRDRGIMGKILFGPQALITSITGDNGLIGRTVSFATHPGTLATIAGGAIIGAGANNDWFENTVLHDNIPLVGGTNPLQVTGNAINTVGSHVGEYAGIAGEGIAKGAAGLWNGLNVPTHAQGFADWYRGNTRHQLLADATN